MADGKESQYPPSPDATPPAPHARPIAAASAALFRGGAVLLVERWSDPAAGRWSLPGGHVEPGESAEAAARREIREETGLDAGRLKPVGLHELLLPPSAERGPVRYEINVFCGPAPDGEPVASSDARAARFIPLDDLEPLPLTDGALSLIRRAYALTHRGS